MFEKGCLPDEEPRWDVLAVDGLSLGSADFDLKDSNMMAQVQNSNEAFTRVFVPIQIAYSFVKPAMEWRNDQLRHQRNTYTRILLNWKAERECRRLDEVC